MAAQMTVDALWGTNYPDWSWALAFSHSTMSLALVLAAVVGVLVIMHALLCKDCRRKRLRRRHG